VKSLGDEERETLYGCDLARADCRRMWSSHHTAVAGGPPGIIHAERIIPRKHGMYYTGIAHRGGSSFNRQALGSMDTSYRLLTHLTAIVSASTRCEPRLKIVRYRRALRAGFTMEIPVQVVYVDPGSPGYHCVYYMARLAAELLNGELVVLHSRPLRMIEKLGALLPRKRRGLACLLICPAPADLSSLLLIENWRERYGRIVAWVFDSFWTSLIPRFARLARVFDHVFVTEQEDLDTWCKMVPAPVEWLPWGSDVLRLGSANPLRRFDLLRMGRQPLQWEDDVSSALVCQSRNLRFQGRPPYFSDATDNQRSLMEILSDAKYTLAFSNLVSPSVQTHPNREYLTGRWTDSLAAGATVAGVPPRSESVRSLLWPEALLDLGTVNRTEGLEVLANTVREWTPDRARLNYIRSLERLDWRWRFKRLADALGVRSCPLDTELKRLNQLISSDLATIA